MVFSSKTHNFPYLSVPDLREITYSSQPCIIRSNHEESTLTHQHKEVSKSRWAPLVVPGEPGANPVCRMVFVSFRLRLFSAPFVPTIFVGGCRPFSYRDIWTRACVVRCCFFAHSCCVRLHATSQPHARGRVASRRVDSLESIDR